MYVGTIVFCVILCLVSEREFNLPAADPARVACETWHHQTPPFLSGFSLTLPPPREKGNSLYLRKGKEVLLFSLPRFDFFLPDVTVNNSYSYHRPTGDISIPGYLAYGGRCGRMAEDAK